MDVWMVYLVSDSEAGEVETEANSIVYRRTLDYRASSSTGVFSHLAPLRCMLTYAYLHSFPYRLNILV
jgi:hypothetical protein